MLNADITGLMAQAQENWQERTRELAKVEHFSVKIAPTGKLWQALTPDEQSRLAEKLELVKKFAAYMAAGMVKGTIKYATDSYNIEQWFAHLLGEGADQANYSLLLTHAYEEHQKAILDHPVGQFIPEVCEGGCGWPLTISQKSAPCSMFGDGKYLCDSCLEKKLNERAQEAP